MDFDTLARRSYLGGVVATVAGLAGCSDLLSSESGSSTEQQPTRQTTETTETSESTTRQTLPEHDHSGGADGGSTLAPTGVSTDTLEAARVNGDVYAAQLPGADLSEKVRNAIEAVPTGGTVVVTPNPDDEPWTWAETVRINLNDTRGLQLLFRGNTMVEYTGESYAIDVTYRPAEYGQLERGDFLRLRGGNWRAPEGANPDGWLRLLDVNFCEIRPERVIDFSNDEGTAAGVRLEIEEIFCESHVISGHFAGCDIGLDLVPSDSPGIAGGKAAASFQGNYVDNPKFLNCNQYGIRVRDGAQCQQMTVMNPDAFAGLTGVADEFVHYYLGGDFDGAMILGPKAEDAGATNDEYEQTDVMFEVPDAMDTPPLVVMPAPDRNVDRIVDYADRFKTLPALTMWKDGFRFQAGVHTLGRRDEQAFFHRGGVDFPGTDLFSNFEGSLRSGHTVYYEGTDDIPAGLYRADPENDQWVKVEDNSVTFSV